TPAFRADGVGSGSVTVGDGGGVIGGDGSGPVVVITNVSMVADFGSTGRDAGSEGECCLLSIHDIRTACSVFVFM
ncbi:hypothetical protein IKG60_00555, partial [Candidatus Saccharibacteria bacterium]|nr:hypothetical protein [Candidatus Saccharibacteria bacterium]